jgi:hypothetical protein
MMKMKCFGSEPAHDDPVLLTWDGGMYARGPAQALELMAMNLTAQMMALVKKSVSIGTLG